MVHYRQMYLSHYVLPYCTWLTILYSLVTRLRDELMILCDTSVIGLIWPTTHTLQGLTVDFAQRRVREGVIRRI